MHFHKVLFFNLSLAFLQFSNAYSEIEFSKRPCAIAYTPDSVLLKERKSDENIRFAGDRPRISTCSGVTWFNNDQFIYAINMEGGTINVYDFKDDENGCSISHLKKIKKKMGLVRPEGLYISNNNKYVAIPTVAVGTKIYKIRMNNTIDPDPIAVLEGNSAHGARFSPDGKYLATTCLGTKARVYVYKIIEKRNKPPEFVRIQNYITQYQPMRPKSIDFTNDGRFVIIGHCKQLNRMTHEAEALISVHKFDGKTGLIDIEPVSVIDKDIYSCETIAFNPDNTAFFAVDQVKDRVTGHEFNSETGEVGRSWVALKNPHAKLSMPHGIGFSKDGKHVAVTSYGDDKVTVYRVNYEK